MRFFVSRLILIMLFSGCAAMNATPPSGIQDGTWNMIRRSGISHDAKHTMIIDKVTVEKDTIFFTPDSEKVTWWAYFQLYTFGSPYQVTFQAKWYDPQGNLFFENEFPLNNIMDAGFVKTSLPIAGTPARQFPGLWQVEIYYGGRLIDKKKFQILAEDLRNYTPLSTDIPIRESLSQLWAEPTTLENSQETPFFREYFEKARDYFQKGMDVESQAYLEKILEKEPFRTEAHLALAAIHFRQTQWDDVLKELDYVLQHPDYREKALELRSKVLEIKSTKEK